MEKLIRALLVDDNGISTSAYDALIEHIETLPDHKKLLALCKEATCMDDRWFFDFD